MPKTDRQELETLRVSLARVAQAAGVQTQSKPVLDKGYYELCVMAKEDRGWNELAGLITDIVYHDRDLLADIKLKIEIS